MNNLRRLYVLNARCPWKLCFGDGRRQLFTNESLGLDKFLSARKKIIANITNVEEFKIKMVDISQKENSEIVLLGDVRRLVAVTETDTDINTLFGLLEKYVEQRSKIQFQRFLITPEIFRLLHYLNKPDKAIALATDPKFQDEVKVFSTVLIFLDLLFENAMYEEVIKYYEYFEPSFTNRSNPLTLLYYAACYKLNTKECYEKAMAHHSKLDRRTIPAKNASILANLALKQGSPVSVFELLQTLRKYYLGDNLMAMALAQVKRYKEALDILERGINMRDFFVLGETLSFIKKQVEDSDEYSAKFLELNNKCENLLVDKTIDSFLFKPVNLNAGRHNRGSSRFGEGTSKFRRSNTPSEFFKSLNIGSRRQEATNYKPASQFGFN